YERPEYLAALQPIAEFIKKNGALYHNAECNAEVGIYTNKASSISDYQNLFHSIQGTIQILFRSKIPFSFIDNDQQERLEKLKVLVIPDVSLVSDSQLAMLKKYLESGKIIMTGESCVYDEFYLMRNAGIVEEIRNHPNTTYLPDTPEKLGPDQVGYVGQNYLRVDYPENADNFTFELNNLYKTPFEISRSDFVTVDSFNTENGTALHILNYDNQNPTDVTVTFASPVKDISFHWPENFGPAEAPLIKSDGGKTVIEVRQLDTYLIVVSEK
ncbi:MAG: hypothetical protein ACYTFY_14340, partial [Planctomycetota bacterium]